MMWWQDEIESYDLYDCKSAGPITTQELVGDTWYESKYLQFLCTNLGTDLSSAVTDAQDQNAASDISSATNASGRTDIDDPDRLSVIPEEDELLAAETCPA